MLRKLVAVGFVLVGSVAVTMPTQVGSVAAASPTYVSLDPVRVVDTRAGFKIDDQGPNPKGVLADGATLQVPVAGRGGVPGDASGVVLNLTATGSTATGYLRVYACGSTPPSTSNLNLQPGSTVANLALSGIGSGGSVCIDVRGGTHLIVDISGYLPSDGSPRLVRPARIVDTRPGSKIDDGGPDPKGARADRSLLRVPVAGRGGVPKNAVGVVLNLTTTSSVGAGFVRVYPCDSTPPSTSNLNIQPGQTVANLAMSQLGPSGDVCIFVRGSTDLIVDVFGYIPSGGAPTLIGPKRIADTRPGSAVDDDGPDPKGMRAAGSVLQLPVAGRSDIPSGVTEAVLNITARGVGTGGYVAVYACGTQRPSTSNLNLRQGATVANLVVTKLGTEGAACVYVSQPTHLIIDVMGYVDPPEVGPPTPGTTTTTKAPSPPTSSTTTPTTPPTPTPVEGAPFQETIVLPPMGSDELHRQLYETSNAGASLFEPVGLYLEIGDVVFIELSNAVHVQAQIGLPDDYDYRIVRTELGNGLNQFVATQEGALFLSNQSGEHTATATVYAGPDVKRQPIFRLGEATDAQVFDAARNATGVPKIFLVGKYFMAYVHRTSLLMPNPETGTATIVESPMAWLQKRDNEVKTYHEYSGQLEGIDQSNANSFPVSRELITTAPHGYMATTSGLVHMNSSSPATMARLFDMDEVPFKSGYSLSWGPWHELGHHQQQMLLSFKESQEATANIYTALLNMNAGHDYGFGRPKDIFPADAFADPEGPQDATELLHPAFYQLLMQLYAAFGPAFYTRMHHLNRLIDHQTSTRLWLGQYRTGDTEAWPLFAYNASKASGYDLTSFFTEWRVPITDEYAQKIADLNLPKPSTDLAARSIAAVKSPADLEGKYQEKLTPYTNLPYANAKSDFMYRYGVTLSPYDLIDYDPAVVAKAEFLNPNQEPFKLGIGDKPKPYGQTMVEILLTGHDGQQNVVVASGMFKPQSWNRYSSHTSVRDHVNSYVNSADFKAGKIDLAEAQVHLDMIHGANMANTAPLIDALHRAIDKKRAANHATPIDDDYFMSLSDADTFLYEGKPAFRFDRTQWQQLIASGGLVVRAFESDTRHFVRVGSDQYLGEVRNGKINPGTLGLIKVANVGADVIVYIDAPFGSTITPDQGKARPIDEISLEIYHGHRDGTGRQFFVTITPDRIGATDQISNDWVKSRFRPEMTYLANGDKNQPVVFSMHQHAWQTILANGQLDLGVYRNGQMVGWTNGTAVKGVNWMLSDGVFQLRTTTTGLAAGDVYELRGTYTSNTSPDLSGPIHLLVTANMLSDEFPIELPARVQSAPARPRP